MDYLCAKIYLYYSVKHTKPASLSETCLGGGKASCSVNELALLFLEFLLVLRPLITGPVHSWSAVLLALHGLARSTLLLARSVAAWDALLVAFLPLHDPPGISSGPVPAPSVRLLLWSRPSAQYLVWTCSCSVCALACLVLSLSGPPNISSGPVPAQSAQHLVWSCPCTVRALARLVLSLHGPSGCSPGPIPARSDLLLALSCPCTVRPAARLVLFLYRPPIISSGLVPVRSAQHLVGSCPCTVRAPACLSLSLYRLLSCLPSTLSGLRSFLYIFYFR